MHQNPLYNWTLTTALSASACIDLEIAILDLKLTNNLGKQKGPLKEKSASELSLKTPMEKDSRAAES